MAINHSLFIPLFVVAVATFCFSCYQRLQLVAVGASENRFDNPAERLAGMFSYAFGQKRVLARPYGFNHFFLFWAFMLLLVANGAFLLEGLFPSFSLTALPAPLHHALEFVFDIVSLVALVSVAIAFVRRVLFPPAYLGNDHTSPRSGEALLILAMIATLMIAFFLLNAAQIAMGQPAGWKPVSSAIASLLDGFSGNPLESIATISWWVHAVVLLLFMNLQIGRAHV